MLDAGANLTLDGEIATSLKRMEAIWMTFCVRLRSFWKDWYWSYVYTMITSVRQPRWRSRRVSGHTPGICVARHRRGRGLGAGGMSVRLADEARRRT